MNLSRLATIIQYPHVTVLISVISTDGGDIVRLSTSRKDVVKTLSRSFRSFIRIGN